MSDDNRPDLPDPAEPNREPAAPAEAGEAGSQALTTTQEPAPKLGRPRDPVLGMTGVMPDFAALAGLASAESGGEPSSASSLAPLDELAEPMPAMPAVEVKRWAPGTSAGQAASILPAKSASSSSFAAQRVNSPLPQFAPTGPTEEVVLSSHRRHRWQPGDEFVPGGGAPESESPEGAAGSGPVYQAAASATYAPRPVSGMAPGEVDQPLRRPSGALRPAASRSSAVIPLPVPVAKLSRWSKFATPAAWLGLALLVVTGTVPWLMRARERAVTPDRATLQQAADRVAKELQPGDALAFTPDWGAHEAGLFDAVWRKKGLNLDSDLLFGDPYDPWTADGHRRLWLVSTHGQFERAEVGAVLLHKDELGHGTAVGLYQLPPSATLFDFRKQLASGRAKIRVGDDKAAWRDCPWRGDPVTGRHGCGGAEYQDVWQGLHEVGGTRRECIFVHPPGDRGTLRLEFGPLPAGAALQGRLGNRLWAVRHGDAGTPVRFGVYVGGQRRWEKTLATDDFTYQPWTVPLAPADAGKDVAFEIYADQEAWREACFDARLVGPSAKP